MKFIKINGARRSGNNYVEWLMNHNFKNVHVFFLGNVTGWRHGLPPTSVDWSGGDWDEPGWLANKSHMKRLFSSIGGLQYEIDNAFADNEVRYVFCVKNPYAYYHSTSKIWGHPKGHPKDTIAKEYVDWWNSVNRAYIDFARERPTRCYVVFNEKLIVDPETEVNNIATRLDLKRTDTFVNQPDVVMVNGPISKGNKFNANFYINREYLNDYSTKTINEINSYIDMGVMENLGYEIVQPR